MIIKQFAHLGINHATPLEAILHAALVPSVFILIAIITAALVFKYLYQPRQSNKVKNKGSSKR